MATNKYPGVSPIDAAPGFARHFEQHPEPLFGIPVKRVLDASPLRKRKIDGLWVFHIPDLFCTSDEVFLGFGVPNAYLTVPNKEGGYQKFAGKSLKRGPSVIAQTRDFVQSGLLLRFVGLPAEAKERLRASMEKFNGQYFETCVRANLTVMQDAGFTSGERPLSDYLFPVQVLTDFLNHGLRYEGQPVQIEIIRTADTWSERFAMRIAYAEALTIPRHIHRALESRAKTSKLAAAALSVWMLPAHALQGIIGSQAAPLAPPVAPGIPYGAAYEKLHVSISMPSRLGFLMRLLWGPHTLFKIEKKGVNIDTYLPFESLPAFPQKNPGSITRMKKKYLFSEKQIQRIRRHLCPQWVPLGEFDERELLDALYTHSKDRHAKYNIGVIGKGEEWSIIIARITVLRKFADWILTKHVLLTGYAEWVPFCGSGWKAVTAQLHIDRDSGTYQPGEDRLTGFVGFMNAILPHIKTVADGSLLPAEETPPQPLTSA